MSQGKSATDGKLSENFKIKAEKNGEKKSRKLHWWERKQRFIHDLSAGDTPRNGLYFEK